VRTANSTKVFWRARAAQAAEAAELTADPLIKQVLAKVAAASATIAAQSTSRSAKNHDGNA
jgi:hypothetical protein